MSVQGILSEQLYDWSEQNIRSLDRLSETQTQPIAQKNPPSKASSEGLHHQAVQPMWKTWMQMRQRAGPWTEILLIGQSPWCTTQAGIHSECIPGTGGIVSCRFPSITRNYRGDLQYQLGAVASKRTFVRRYLASRTLFCCPTCRRKYGRHISRQHARDMAHPRVWKANFIGGER
jgi:hypothetical protein